MGHVGAFAFYAGLNVIACKYLYALYIKSQTLMSVSILAVCFIFLFVRFIDILQVFLLLVHADHWSAQVPETKQRTLEELDQIFSVPCNVFIKYQTRKALPYWISRYVMFNRNAKLEPLYHLDTDVGYMTKDQSYHAPGQEISKA